MNLVSERVVEDDDVVFETKAMSMRWVPLTLFASNGLLRLDHGRFTFSTRHGAPKLDTAASELHSVAPMMSRGIHVWHGSRRFRFAMGAPSVPLAPGLDPLLGPNQAFETSQELAALPGVLSADQQKRRDTATWIALLREREASPPSDVSVRPPWPTWTWIAGPLAAAAALGGAITALVLAL
jgi:hypothetical protein